MLPHGIAFWHLASDLRLKSCRQQNNSLAKRNKGPGSTRAVCFQHSRPVPLHTCPVWGVGSVSSWEGNPLFSHAGIKEGCPTRKNKLPYPKPSLVSSGFSGRQTICVAVHRTSPFASNCQDWASKAMRLWLKTVSNCFWWVCSFDLDNNKTKLIVYLWK